VCGRFTLFTPADVLAEAFGLAGLPGLRPRFNIAPTQEVLAVRPAGAGRGPAFLRWGLIPSWAAEQTIAHRLINARAETVADKPAFRSAFARRRCLVPADGFYEWQPVAGKKQPVLFRLRDGRPFAFAGLWESWEGAGGEVVESCAILTTPANDLVRPVHERMPVILDPRHHDDWLDPGLTDAQQLRSWLRAFPAEEMTATRVSPHVNNPRHDDARCVQPLPESGLAPGMISLTPPPAPRPSPAR
jgi:putative SOS response-associated peptidase YedK